MKTINIYYKFLTLLLVATLAVSCDDFLDRRPLDSYTADNYPFPEGGGVYDQEIFAAYGQLKAFHVSTMGFVAAANIRSEDADKGSSPADGPTIKQMDDFQLLPSNAYVNNKWIGYYTLVEKANLILQAVENDVTDTPEEIRTQAIAEARFIRGYAYFHLVRVFGNIPLIDKIFTDVESETNVPQSTPAVIYDFIEQDLIFAAANLPSGWSSNFIGRVTKGSANGILAKVYLYQKKWQQAMDAAQAVISSGVYDLNTPYDKIFGEEGENCSESVFELQCYADATYKASTVYGSQWSQVQGVRGSGEWNMGWGFNSPSEQLDNAYEPDDPRKARTILYAGGKSYYGEDVPIGLPNPRYNHKALGNPAKMASVGARSSFWMNIRILRYADVVLMYAEAANELGKATEALDKLEWVRARARNGNNDILPKVTTTNQGELRDAIHHERRIELAMEHERFFDIVRWGIAKEVLHAAGKTNYTEGKDELFPIPQAQLDLSKGVLKQNPGY